MVADRRRKRLIISLDELMSMIEEKSANIAEAVK